MNGNQSFTFRKSSGYNQELAEVGQRGFMVGRKEKTGSVFDLFGGELLSEKQPKAKPASMEEKRQRVLRDVENWIAVKSGDKQIADIPRNKYLSRIVIKADGQQRTECVLKYGSQSVEWKPGKKVWSLNLDKVSEAEFWKKVAEDIRAGVFDDRINEAAERLSSARMGWRKKPKSTE